MRTKKGIIIFLIGMIVICTALLLYEKFMYMNSKVTCGEIVKQEQQARGGYSIYYNFYVDDVKYSGSIESSALVDISLDSLKQIECIQIEYSLYSKFFNRIIDSRILCENQ